MAERSKQFFHGTTHDLQGPDILPSVQHGRSVWGNLGHSGQRADSHAFATESEDVAWQFASQAGMMTRAREPSPGVTGRVRVHTVAPNPLMRRGVFHAEHPAHNGGDDLKEWVAPAFRVTGTIDTMPGRQGTFPSLNWNQFKKPAMGYEDDLNHPTDRQISVGTSRAGNYWHQHWSDFSDQRNVPPGVNTSVVDEHQRDLFSGDTVGDHVEMDDSPVGDYHRNNLFGRL